MTTTFNPSELISEAEVYKKYPNLFADRELREARKSGKIAFFNLRKGVYYSPDQIAAYLNSKVTIKCQNKLLSEDEKPSGPDEGAAGKSPASSKSATTGSTTPTREARSSTIAGMTPELEKRAAARLE